MRYIGHGVTTELVDLPRIGQKILNCVVYLYDTPENARDGKNTGGTGFVIFVESERHRGTVYSMVVTCRHVAVEDGHSCVRINGKDGLSNYIEADPSDWIWTDISKDLAILPISIDAEFFDVTPLHKDMLLSNEDAVELDIGVADDVMMIGRFIDQDGGVVNSPVCRFGNISSMPVLSLIHI